MIGIHTVYVCNIVFLKLNFMVLNNNIDLQIKKSHKVNKHTAISQVKR